MNWMRLLKAWHNKAHQPYVRIAPITCFTALALGSFAAAGLLSSKIASLTGQEVLIRGGGLCGVNSLGHAIPGQDKNPQVEVNPALFTVFIPFLAQRLISFSNYALNCYSDDAMNRGCNNFVKTHLKSTSNTTAECPFHDELCHTKNGNLFLDTGYMNSHFDFGINAPPDERFLYRRTTHCAPLVTDGHRSSVNLSTPGYERSYMQYFYGSLGSGTKSGNVTYSYPMAHPLSMNQTTPTAYEDYTIGYVYTNVINGSVAGQNNFKPIDALFRTDADVSVFFLSRNQVVSPVPIDDPWYSAHTTVPGYNRSFVGWDNLTIGGYFADEPASALGCAKQYQICYPDSRGNPSHCSRMGGKQELYYLLQSLPQGEKQLNLTSWSIMAALTGNEIDAFVQTLGVASLNSRYSLVSGVQGPLPNNQWQLDVQHWHAASLAAIQGSAIDAATGPSDASVRQFWAPPANDQERYICNNQKILSGAHGNFNVFGLGFTFAVGGVIILISFLLEPLAGFIQKRYSRHPYSRLEWCINGTLQLQRLAHEEVGYGTWTDCTKQAPTCQTHDKLAFVDMGDLKHPIFSPPSPEGVVVTEVTSDGIDSESLQATCNSQSEEQKLGKLHNGTDALSPIDSCVSPSSSDRYLEGGDRL